MKVKSILVSQPKPGSVNTPYALLSKNQKVKVDFIPFIHVEGVTPLDVRKQKVDFSKFTAIIFTSRNAIDHFFRLAEEMRFNVPSEYKYFCISDAIANYLHKYIIYRKRKIYVGKKTIHDLSDEIKRFPDENYLLPCSDKLKEDGPKLLDSLKIKWKKVILYKTVHSDLSNLESVFYDILVFFSPSGIDSLFKNFPNFNQKDTRIAVFGNSTAEAATKAGLECNIKAPSPETPSMTMALEKYISEANKK